MKIKISEMQVTYFYENAARFAKVPQKDKHAKKVEHRTVSKYEL